MAELSAVGDSIRQHLALGLDFDDHVVALERAIALKAWFGVAKVGHELYAAAGPRIIAELRDLGYEVFLDAKLHDIPHTVQRAARVLARYGIAYLNFHTSGGLDMLRAGIEGAHEGAALAGTNVPRLLGVTVLTSDTDMSAFAKRLALASESGCDGVVCSALEVADVKGQYPNFVTMVPGIRLAGSDANDQARIATPHDAIRAGADVLVIVRTVHQAVDPQAAAAQVFDEVARALD